MKLSSNRRIAVVVFVCVVPILSALFLRSGSISDRVYDFALYMDYRAGADFYRDHAGEKFRTDERWLSALLFEYRQSVVSGEVEPVNRDPFLRVLSERKRAFSLFESLDPVRTESGYGYRIRSDYRRFLVDPWDDVLLRALYCRTYGYSDRDFSVLASIPLDGGYADTHKLLGLIFLREDGCYDRDTLDRMIRQGAEHVARSAEADTEWSDLFSERVVFLYWAGEGSLVKREWIERIADAQGGGGAWTDPAWNADSDAHSTGLSMLAIRYFLEGKPETEFFAPLDPIR